MTTNAETAEALSITGRKTNCRNTRLYGQRQEVWKQVISLNVIFEVLLLLNLRLNRGESSEEVKADMR